MQQVGATLHCGAWASHCGDFFVVEHRLWPSGLSSCSMWDLGTGIELVSPTLAGGFLAIASPGKPRAIKLRNGIGFLCLILFYLFISSVQFCCSVMSDSLQPHGLQPTRLLHPWDFSGKSTGVGCHCLLQGLILECLN